MSLSADPETLLSPDGVLAAAINLIFSVSNTNEISLSLEVQAVMPGAEGMQGMLGMEGAPGQNGSVGTDQNSFQLATYGDPSGGISPGQLQFFEAGELINNSLSYDRTGSLINNDVVNSEWAFDPTGSGTGYAGFVFTSADGTPLYGWIEIQFDLTGTDFTILGWGYDDTGAPIAAGVPEPSTGLLLALGLAGLSAVSRRRHRRKLRKSAKARKPIETPETDAPSHPTL